MRIFVSQALLDQWLGGGGIHLDGDLIQMNAAGTPMTLYINPAVYFERVDGSDQDAYDVVGAVKTSQELAQMGGEHYETSVVLGDYAYTVVPGFLAVPVGADGTETVLDGSGWGQLLTGISSLSPGYV